MSFERPENWNTFLTDILRPLAPFRALPVLNSPPMKNISQTFTTVPVTSHEGPQFNFRLARISDRLAAHLLDKSAAQELAGLAALATFFERLVILFNCLLPHRRTARAW